MEGHSLGFALALVTWGVLIGGGAALAIAFSILWSLSHCGAVHTRVFGPRPAAGCPRRGFRSGGGERGRRMADKVPETTGTGVAALRRPELLVVGLVVLAFAPAAGAAGLSLQWDPAIADDRVAGYEVHYGLASGQYESVIDADANGAATDTQTITGLEAGSTYYFAVRAVDDDRTLASAFSNEVSATIPSANFPVADFAATPTSGEEPSKGARPTA